jgi:hypothetical protein
MNSLKMERDIIFFFDFSDFGSSERRFINELTSFNFEIDVVYNISVSVVPSIDTGIKHYYGQPYKGYKVFEIGCFPFIQFDTNNLDTQNLDTDVYLSDLYF